MERIYLTQLFPWIRPLRKKQRKFFFYTKMKWDKNRYARRLEKERFGVKLFESVCPMYNQNTGFAMVYQENKVFNLKLAAATIDGLVIAPGETFSFWALVKDADRKEPYKSGLAEVNGRLVTEQGGGLCQLSNLLCWVLLHSPLTVTERHGHRKKDFPEPESDAPMGVDAAVAEGWLDLRFRNDTEQPFQIGIFFTEKEIGSAVYAEREPGVRWEVANENLKYCRDKNGIREEVDVVRTVRFGDAGKTGEKELVYRNCCRIGYPLPPGTKMEEIG